MGYFTGLNKNDHEEHFNALRQMVNANHGVSLVPTQKREEIWHEAETVFTAPLGPEVKPFLGFIADIDASGMLDKLVGDKGKMKTTDPCQYQINLRSLADIDPSFRGISFMATSDTKSYFSILNSQQACSPCPTACYSVRKYKGKSELALFPYGDTSLISFAIRFFGQKSIGEGLALASCTTDDEAFHEEACKCFGPPAELGGGNYLFEADNAEILIRPITDIGINLHVFDLSKQSPVSDKLLKLLEGGLETFKA